MRSLLRTLGAQLGRDLLALAAGMVVIGASFGAIAVSAGMPWWMPSMMSVLVFAGSAQFLAVGVIAAGGGWIAAVAAACILNARLLPFGVAIGQHLGPHWWLRLIGSHFIVDESVALALAQSDPRRARAAFFAAGAAVFMAWNTGTLIGALAGGVLGDPRQWGLDAAFPAALLAFVLPNLRDRATMRAAVCGAAIAVASTPLLGGGLPVLLGLLGLAAVGKNTATKKEALA